MTALFDSTDEPNGLAAVIVNEVEALIRKREAAAYERGYDDAFDR
jgi:hypothetical protein